MVSAEGKIMSSAEFSTKILIFNSLLNHINKNLFL